MITTLTGTNYYLLQAELSKITQGFIEQYTDMVLERFDGDELTADALKGAVQSMPFLVERKMVVVRNAASNKDVTEHIEDILQTVTDTTDLILVEDKLDKRSVYYKILKKQTDFREFSELDERGLSKWLMEQAKAEKGSLSPGDAAYLVQRIGPNQLMLASELAKLMNYDSKVTRETIDLLTEPTPQSTIFELLDAAFSGDTARALEIYADQRKQKVEPLAIVAMLAWQLHVLALIKVAGKRTPDEIAKEASISPYVVRKSLSIVRTLSLTKLKQLISDALQLDIDLKSKSINADDALQTYLLSMAIQG